MHLTKRKRDPEQFDLTALARASDGFSGAEIEEVTVTAMYDAFYGDTEVDQKHLLRACADSVPLSKTMSEKIDALRKWSQGRARPAGNTRSKVTVARRGRKISEEK